MSKTFLVILDFYDISELFESFEKFLTIEILSTSHSHRHRLSGKDQVRQKHCPAVPGLKNFENILNFSKTLTIKKV